MKVLVCGGRDYADVITVDITLNQVWMLDGDAELLLIHGGAKGADTLAGEWARLAGAQEVIVPANWDRNGKKAGPMRNQAMLALRPDLVVAFPGGRGTADMVRRANKHGVPVREITA